MAEIKTKPTDASIEEYLHSRATHQQLQDAQELLSIMQRITGHDAKMWGPSIVGFGAYRYTYASGHSGEACLTGFAIRKTEIVVYLAPTLEQQSHKLSRLGKHKIGKGCLYFKRLSDLDTEVLEELITNSIAEIRHKYSV